MYCTLGRGVKHRRLCLVSAGSVYLVSFKWHVSVVDYGIFG